MSNAITSVQQDERLNVQRTFEAPLDLVWELWTTKNGIESWWGPDGFEVSVKSIDVRAEGRLEYEMTAVNPEMRAFMKREGMPISTQLTIMFTEVSPKSRLRYIGVVDFVPGVDPYENTTEVEFISDGSNVTVNLIFDKMHDADWSERKMAGWTNELGKLDVAIRRLRQSRA